MASNPPPSGPGQPWPANPNDTPGTGYQTGGAPQQGGWPPPAAPAPSQWAQPAPSQWAQPPQGAPAPQAQPPAQSQWGQQPVRPPQTQWGQQAQQGQWPPQPPAGQQPAQNQWAQQPQQGSQWPAPPPVAQPQAQQSQWAQQPQQGQWGQQAQQGQWPPQPPPGNQWAPAAAAAGWTGYDTVPAVMDYPVDVRFTPEGRIGRYWGIPLLGFLLRYLLIIPHVILLVFVGLVAYLATWLTWIPVLLTGRYPGWGYTLVGGYLRWAIRVGTWLFLLSGTYPPFTGSPSDGQHVEVLFDEQRPVGRFWGIPVLGIAIRAILCIPHFIVLWLLAIVIYILILFTWLPVLIYGRQADFMYSIIGGYVRWATRVYAYLLLLSGPYPPFRLS